MAEKKPRIVRDAEGYWSVLELTAEGTERTKGNLGHIPPIELMEERKAILTVLGLAKDASNKRIACVSILCAILQEQIARVEAWQGKGNASKGVDVELKGAFQKCEDRYFEDRILNAEHEDHAIYLGQLPKEDARGNPLELDGKLEPRKQFEAFLTNTRKEPSYANAKSTVLAYFNLCGKMPFDPDGSIVPPEIMAQEVANARTITPKDNSLRARLWELRNELIDEAQAPPGDDLPVIMRTLREMLEMATQLENIHAARLTARGGNRVGDSIADKGAEAIRKAQESTGRVQTEVPALPAPAKPEARELPPETSTAQ